MLQACVCAFAVRLAEAALKPPPVLPLPALRRRTQLDFYSFQTRLWGFYHLIYEFNLVVFRLNVPLPPHAPPDT